MRLVFVCEVAKQIKVGIVFGGYIIRQTIRIDLSPLFIGAKIANICIFVLRLVYLFKVIDSSWVQHK